MPRQVIPDCIRNPAKQKLVNNTVSSFPPQFLLGFQP